MTAQLANIRFCVFSINGCHHAMEWSIEGSVNYVVGENLLEEICELCNQGQEGKAFGAARQWWPLRCCGSVLQVRTL